MAAEKGTRLGAEARPGRARVAAAGQRRAAPAPARTGTGGSYGWVSYPGAGYTINAIWGDRADALWAVTSGGQLLSYDGAAWQFVFGGGTPTLNSIWGLPGQTAIFFVGAGSQFYLLQGANVYDLGSLATSDNRAVWAAGADRVWVGSSAAGLGLRRFDLTVASPSGVSDGPSDLQGVNAIWGPSADEIWLIDSTGGLVHLLNQTWTHDTSISNPGFTGINGTGSQDVWAVGPYGLFHWNGTAWSEINQGHNAGLFGVWAAGPSEAWAVGDGGKIVHVTTTTFQNVPERDDGPSLQHMGHLSDGHLGGRPGRRVAPLPIDHRGHPGRRSRLQGRGRGMWPWRMLRSLQLPDHRRHHVVRLTPA